MNKLVYLVVAIFATCLGCVTYYAYTIEKPHAAFSCGDNVTILSLGNEYIVNESTTFGNILLTNEPISYPKDWSIGFNNLVDGAVVTKQQNFRGFYLDLSFKSLKSELEYKIDDDSFQVKCNPIEWNKGVNRVKSSVLGVPVEYFTERMKYFNILNEQPNGYSLLNKMLIKVNTKANDAVYDDDYGRYHLLLRMSRDKKFTNAQRNDLEAVKKRIIESSFDQATLWKWTGGYNYTTHTYYGYTNDNRVQVSEDCEKLTEDFANYQTGHYKVVSQIEQTRNVRGGSCQGLVTTYQRDGELPE